MPYSRSDFALDGPRETLSHADWGASNGPYLLLAGCRTRNSADEPTVHLQKAIRVRTESGSPVPEAMIPHPSLGERKFSLSIVSQRWSCRFPRCRHRLSRRFAAEEEK